MNARVAIPLLSLIFVMGLALSGAARANAQASTAVHIETTSIIGTTLKIEGRNFGGAVPAVSIDDTNAAVSSNSDTEIVAVTPALEPGMHILKIVRDANAGGTAVTTLQIR
jgi:hypothetical protein